MKIDRQIIVAFAVMLLLVSIIGATSFISSNRVATLSDDALAKQVLSQFTVEKEVDHLVWSIKVSEGVFEGHPIKVQMDPTKCGIGKWIYKTLEQANVSEEMLALVKEIEPVHRDLHNSGAAILEKFGEGGYISSKMQSKAARYYEHVVQKNLEKVRAGVNKIKEQLKVEVDAVTEETKETTHGSIIIIAILTAVSIGIALFFAFISVRRLLGFSKEMLEGSSRLAYGSDEISKGNQDLSSRTQQQASSLEETASTLEEITATVKQTTDNSQMASQLSNKSVEISKQGGELSGEVQVAMGNINESSKQISEIVALVDEIAFQTNILAINAAIEAAKAGDMGKGFAVVAIEVRDLAQRSAEAAKEIRDLVTNSAHKVEGGLDLVAKNSEMLKEIAGSAEQVADIMAEISSATKEQLSAIEQINRAVTELDSVTQQNSALVEEVAGASENMASDNRQMEEMIRKNFTSKKSDFMTESSEE